jgi:ribonucleoside-diphosphate reductase alpha chain
MEFVAYHSTLASSRLAAERGRYASYAGSKWDRGLLPQDTIALLEIERGMPIDVDRSAALDWGPLRQQVAAHGMRNSNTMAIAPTATISTIAGCFPSFEPLYKNIYVKSNISGEFTVVNPYLIEDLRAAGLWNEELADELKFRDGSVQDMTQLSDHLRNKYKVAFEIDPLWYLKLAAARGKWIDQSQSLNIFMRGTSGRQLSDIYLEAWKLGLKTTYYLRTMAASQIEKATLDSRFGLTQKRSGQSQPAAFAPASVTAAAVAPASSVQRPEVPAPTPPAAVPSGNAAAPPDSLQPALPTGAAFATNTTQERNATDAIAEQISAMADGQRAYQAEFELAAAADASTVATEGDTAAALSGQYCTDPESCEACQ